MQELFPGNFAPTPAHYFMKLLYDKGLLLRCFTQVRLHLGWLPNPLLVLFALCVHPLAAALQQKGRGNNWWGCD
jgi:hypothetical protein